MNSKHQPVSVWGGSFEKDGKRISYQIEFSTVTEAMKLCPNRCADDYDAHILLLDEQQERSLEEPYISLFKGRRNILHDLNLLTWNRQIIDTKKYQRYVISWRNFDAEEGIFMPEHCYHFDSPDPLFDYGYDSHVMVLL